MTTDSLESWWLLWKFAFVIYLFRFNGARSSRLACVFIAGLDLLLKPVIFFPWLSLGSACLCGSGLVLFYLLDSTNPRE